MSFEKACLIGLRSGLWGGRKRNFALTEPIAARTPSTVWLCKLSITTMSPGLSVGDEDLLNIVTENVAIDRAFDDHRGREAVAAQRHDEGGCFPMPMRDCGQQALAPRRPALQPGHVRGRPGFVDKDEAFHILWTSGHDLAIGARTIQQRVEGARAAPQAVM